MNEYTQPTVNVVGKCANTCPFVGQLVRHSPAPYHGRNLDNVGNEVSVNHRLDMVWAGCDFGHYPRSFLNEFETDTVHMQHFLRTVSRSTVVLLS